MKQGHFVIIIFNIFIICFWVLSLEQKQYDEVMKEKQKVEEALLSALEYTAKSYAEVLGDSEDKRKHVVATVFSEMLCVSLGLVEEVDAWEKIELYLPLLIVAEEDGAWFYYLHEEEKNGIRCLEHSWTEKMEIGEIDEKASWYISNHNYIASQYGLEYLFTVPEFMVETKEKFPSIIVVFQGWPLSASGDLFYENCLDAAVYLQEKEYYLLERPMNLEDSSCWFHRPVCTAFQKETQEIWVTEEEAIYHYGAFPCGECIP